ncbi:transporter [Limnohabitans sp. Rim8]|jgi:osmotically-inducible protein OsmY|uniref:Transporter n=1 Tax=Limnohabitans curvus TaxID=323423 RepID=A0A315EQN2_9BURK|nr:MULTISPECIES: BON domain-containing protein [Limnohabitans]PUE54896.1 transporter [Limnohabitans sp. Rim8]PUE59549.1 transporter [Limnohabitans curvus]BDU51942.1 phospholipid-binding protein [Limnohabitans sp. INBF002]
MTSKFVKAALALLAALQLSACAPLMFGGVIGGAMVASDRRTAGIQVEDEGIEQRSATAIRENFGSKEHINITSYNRQVLITGEVSNDTVRSQTEQLIGRVQNVRSVVNELVIGPASSMGDRSNDVLLVAKVKAAMVDSEDVFANVFKVVGERGTVYLMGRVTQREAKRATDVVRGVSGVKRVVRVFEYITEDELRAMQPKRSDSQSVDLNAPKSNASQQPVVTPIK